MFFSLVSDKILLLILKPSKSLVLYGEFKARGGYELNVLDFNCLTPMGSLAFREDLWLQRFDPDGVSKSKLN